MTTFMAAMTVVGCGVAGLVLDLSSAYSARKQLQIAVDAAALGALRELPDGAAVRLKALEIVEHNLPAARYGNVVRAADVETGTWGAGAFLAGTVSPNAVRVTAARRQANDNPVRTLFASVLGHHTMDLSARAVATRSAPAECIHALRPDGDNALTLTGGSEIEVPGCGVMVYSTGKKAINVSGGGGIVAQRTRVAGGTNLGGGSIISPEAETGVEPVPDPLAGLTPPSYGGCTNHDLKVAGGSRALVPGVYCGGIVASSGAKLRFAQGVYIVKDGPIQTTGGGSFEGDGVGFYLTGPKAQIDFGGGPSVRLSAPRSGPMRGMLFWQAPGAPAGETSKVTGGGNLWLEGAIYMPDQKIEWSGGTTGTVAPYTVMIARNFLISGGGSLRMGADYAKSTVPLPLGLGGAQERLAQ